MATINPEDVNRHYQRMIWDTKAEEQEIFENLPYSCANIDWRQADMIAHFYQTDDIIRALLVTVSMLKEELDQLKSRS